MPANEIQLSAGDSTGARLRTYSATENSTVVHYQPAWIVFGANSTSPTVVTSAAGLPVVAQSGATWQLASNSGVDVGDVTINNSSAGGVPVDLHIDGRGVQGSTGNHTSTAFGLVARLVGNSSVVIASGTSTVVIASGTSTVVIASGESSVTIKGNSTSILSTLGMGGTIDNPMWALPLANFPDSTRGTLKLSSTTPSTLISSGASTRINVVDLEVTGTDAQTLFMLFSNSTASTSLLYQEIISSGGGGFGRTFSVPIRTVVAQSLVAQIDPASTGVYINYGAFRST